MKLLKEFDSLNVIAASGSNAEFPVTNLQSIEPNLRWWVNDYAGDVWVTVDRGAGAPAIDTAVLNNANFPMCRLQGNPTNEWSSPAVNILANLGLDRIANRKGWFDLGTFTQRWFRLLIPAGQTLDAGEPIVPALGNLLLGSAEVVPTVGEIRCRVLAPKLVQQFISGRVRKKALAIKRQVLGVTINDDWASIRGFRLAWDIAAISADLGSPADVWLVYGPDESDGTIRWAEDADDSMTLDEVV